MFPLSINISSYLIALLFPFVCSSVIFHDMNRPPYLLLSWCFSPLCAFILLTASCTVVPDSGRQQFNLYHSPEKQAQLARMGFDEFNKLKHSKKISTNALYNAQVRRVGKRLSRVMPVPNAQWEFVVFDDPEANAFALPGGKVGINAGLFQVTQSDAGLATVIGHEVGHVVANHAGERLTGNMATAIVGAAAYGVINQNTDLSTGGQAATAAAIGAAGTLNSLRFSRAQELEADRLGALYMARSGYDPRESVKLWKRFANYKQSKSNGQKPEFLSTHPLDSTRISALENFLPRAMEEYQRR